MPSKLTIGGCDAAELAQKYGTPLYLYDEGLLRKNCQRYLSAFKKSYGKSHISYAAKAFWCLAMARLIQEEGLCVDVASAGELYTALEAGFPAERIYLHGNCKSAEEIEMAMNARVHRIIVDNEGELDLIEKLAGKRGIRANILLRVTLGIEAATHKAIKTGHWDTKFGFYESGGAALRGAQKALKSKHITLMGFHAHIGSQIFRMKDYASMVKSAFDFLQEVRTKTGFVAKELDLGGGLAVAYTESSAPSIEEYAKTISSRVIQEAKKRKFNLPELIVEPGRSIAAEAGTTIYTIPYVKQTPSKKTFVIVDGGLSDNPRPLMYGAKYRVSVIPATCGERSRTKAGIQALTVAGKHCESDILFEDIRLPQPKPGDLLAVFSTGAYNYSMASNYNRYGKPPVVFCKEGKSRIVVQRENLEDLIRQDS